MSLCSPLLLRLRQVHRTPNLPSRSRRATRSRALRLLLNHNTLQQRLHIFLWRFMRRLLLRPSPGRYLRLGSDHILSLPFGQCSTCQLSARHITSQRTLDSFAVLHCPSPPPLVPSLPSLAVYLVRTRTRPSVVRDIGFLISSGCPISPASMPGISFATGPLVPSALPIAAGQHSHV